MLDVFKVAVTSMAFGFGTIIGLRLGSALCISIEEKYEARKRDKERTPIGSADAADPLGAVKKGAKVAAA